MFTILTQKGPGRPPFFSGGGRLSYVSGQGVSFAVLRLPGRRRINWRKVKKRLGDSASRTLWAGGVSPPAESGIRQLDCRRYSQLLARNGLEALLSKNSGLPAGGRAVLVDLHCRYQDFADILVRFFPTVRIVTRRDELYRHYVDARFYDCGAAVLIGNTVEREEADLYVSPDGVLFPAMENVRAPVLTVSAPPVLPGGPVVSDFRAPTPSELDLAPPDVDAHRYQAALLSCCGVGKLAAAVPDSALLSGEVRTLSQLKTCLFSIDKPPEGGYN